MNKISTKLFIALFLSSIFALKAQENAIHNEHNHTHIDEFKLPLEFDKDSLQGFNEEAALQQARMSTDETWRQRRLVAIAKRSYIDFKYGFAKAAPFPTVQGPCTNPDFETGTTAGWTMEQSNNNNSITMLPWNGLATTLINVVSPGNDPNIGAALPMVPPGGGNFSCLLGSNSTSGGGTSFRATQIFTVTPSNSVFIYRYAVVLERTSPHSCSEQPFFNVTFKDCNGNPIQCGSYAVTVAGSGCTNGDPTFNTSNATWAYKPWTTAAYDLTSYIGQCVSLEFTVGGCVISQAAHRGYAYIDASCSPMTLNLNGADIPVGQTNNSMCNASTTNTLCAPPGFTYNWTGPGVTGQTGQCINTSSTGTYSVTLGIAGTTCSFSPVLYSTFNSVPNPTVTASLTQPVCALPAGSATLNVNGGAAPFTYSWSPAAPSASVNTNLPAGTSYTATVTDDNGCVGSTTFSVDPYPPAPSYTLDVSPSYSLSCGSPSTTITFAQTGTNTAVSWGGPSGTITGTNVVVTTPGTYTYSAINTISTCSLTGSIVITSDVNLPSATYTVSCNTNTINLTATPNSTNTASWIAPTSPTTNIGNPASSTAIGIYTLVVTDPANGCVQTYTTLTTLPQIGIASSPTTNVITCTNPTVQATASSTSQSVTLSWNNGTSTVTTNPLPINATGSYTAIATNALGCVSQSVVTVGIDTTVNASITPSSTLITCATGSVTLAASSSAGGPYTYNWIPGTTTGTTYTANAAGTYTVVALNTTNGCTTTATQTLQMETVSATFVGDPYNGQMPLPVSFTNTSINPTGTTYSWDFGDGHGLNDDTTFLSHTYETSGTFTVILTAQNGFCRDTAMRYVQVDLISTFEVPNVFTPNGDGKNDVFTFRAINMGEIHLMIYDRWGLLMFDGTDTGNIKWDGKTKGGKVVPDGAYFYIIHAYGLDGVKYDQKGSIQVFQ